MKNFRENLMHMVFFLCALTSIFAVVLICIFLFANGVPAMKEIGLLDFLTGAKWKPGNDIYGILPMILGSLYITAGAIVIGVPIGLLTAVFMAFYSSRAPNCWPVFRPSYTASSAWSLSYRQSVRWQACSARISPAHPLWRRPSCSAL